MIYISDLSWTKKIKHPSEFVNVGDKLDVVVLELDVEGRKLSLGHKQTTENPWDKHEDAFAIGTVHTGKITELVDKGATVDFGEDVRKLEMGDGHPVHRRFGVMFQQGGLFSSLTLAENVAVRCESIRH